MNFTSATASLSITFYWALGKDFAECHSVTGKEKLPSWCQVTTTESVPNAHRVTLGKGYLFAKCLLLAPDKGITRGPLLSVPLLSTKATTLDKNDLPLLRCAFFAECYVRAPRGGVNR